MSNINERYRLGENEWIDEEEEFSDSSPKLSVQLPPVVQPLAIVPYNTQEQPLFQYADSSDGSYDNIVEDYTPEPYEREEVYARYPEAADKRVRSTPVFLMLFSLVILAILILGEFVLKEYLILSSEMSGYAYIMKVVETFTSGEELVIAELIIPGAVVIIALFSLINLVANLAKIKSRGACVISKICIFFMISFSLVLVLVNLINEETIGYGLYGVAGLSFLSLLIGYLAKKDIKY